MYFDKAQEQFYPSDVFFYCENCEEKILEEDDGIFIANGKCICQNCFEEYYNKCVSCGEIYADDELNDSHMKGPLCEECAGEIDE